MKNDNEKGQQLMLSCELREKDLNLRPSGYEPDELPDCSIPRYSITSFSKFNGAYRARTYDPLLVRQMLSQLS